MGETVKDEAVMAETENLQAMPPKCSEKPWANCSECCELVNDNDTRRAFGYNARRAQCECHDIVVEDVRDIGVEDRTLFQCIPDGLAGCRGGFIPSQCVVPEIESVRVMCSDESLGAATGCDRIENEIGFEVVLRYGSTYVVVTPRDSFCMQWNDFVRFPSGKPYKKCAEGKNDFKEELALIDGSSKVIQIKCAKIVRDCKESAIKIEYTVVNKLWKYESLLVSAIKPYAGNGEYDSMTVTNEFGAGQNIRSCYEDPYCTD